MLEILLLIHLCKRIGAMAEARGRSSGGYQTLLVASWVGAEFACLFGGMALFENPGAGYLLALLGAAGAAAGCFIFVNNLSPISVGRRGFDVVVAPPYPAAPPPRDKA